MGNKPSRREMLKLTAAALTPMAAGLAGAARVLAQAPAAEKPQHAPKLTAYQDGPQIWVRWFNTLVTSYEAHPTQKLPYFAPLAGPQTGLSLTTETSMPYPHHRSLFFGCDRVNGGNYWQEPVERGQIVSLGPKLGEVTEKTVAIADQCQWRKPGQEPVMSDERKIRVEVLDEERTFIDVEIKWTAVQDVTIEKTNHSLFSVRAAPDITPLGGGTLMNSRGQESEKGTFGQSAGWCTFYGKRAGVPGDVVEGIALFNDPRSPWGDCPWFTRDYGFMSPTPFYWIESPWKLAAGKSVDLRYRVVLYAGLPRDALLEELYKAWVA